MNNNLPRHLLPNLFLTSHRSLQCGEHGRNGTLSPGKVLCCEMVAGGKGRTSSVAPLSITVDRKQMDKRRVRGKKNCCFSIGAGNLPVLLQQPGNTCWFFGSLGRFDNVKWSKKLAEVGGGHVNRPFIDGNMHPRFYRGLCKISKKKSFFDHFCSSVKVKTVQRSQTDTAPSEVCCCAR